MITIGNKQHLLLTVMLVLHDALVETSDPSSLAKDDFS
jgi:hypothetical protein